MKKSAVYVVIVLGVAGALYGATSLQDIVAANYPSTLTARAVQRHYPDARRQAFASITTPTASYIVAAYSNSRVGAVLLLQKNSTGSYAVVDQPPGIFVGRKPSVQAVDLDGDDVSEVLVTLENGRAGASTWVYGISSSKLVLLSPLDKQGDTVLATPCVLDLGTGVSDLIDQQRSGPGASTITSAHYVLKNGKFLAAEPLDYFNTFYREKGTPVVETRTIDIPPSAIGKAYRVVIVNGGTNGASARVTSGEVRLNTVLLEGPSDFSQHRSVLTVPISLQEHNTLTVRLEGQPGSRITVIIKHD